MALWFHYSNKLLEKQEIYDGFVYTFAGDDALFIEAIEFIRQERTSSPTFKFELTIRDKKSPILLKITGPDGVKERLKDDLQF